MTDESYNSYIKKAYTRIAELYDVGVFVLSRTREKVVKLSNAPESSRILDIATGTGKQAYAFGKHGFNVVGIDITEAMIKLARKNNKYSNISFEIADAARLPFAADEFDLTTVSWALHDMPPGLRESVLLEMKRVTKPSCILLFVDFASPEKGFRRWIIRKFIPVVESRYYSDFIRSGLKELLIRLGFQIEIEVPIVFGLGKLVKAVNIKVAS